MSNTREERETRRNKDTGGATDTVYYSNKNKMESIRAYHDNPKCGRLENAQYGLSSDERRLCKARDWYPCSICVLKRDPNDVNNGGGKSKLEVLIENDRVPSEILGSAYDES